MKERPRQIRTDDDLTPETVEAMLQHYDKLMRELEQRLQELESRIYDLENP